ncbi:ATP-binding cassette domain-containing protein [Gallaecimonas xiamenensis]|uniref:Peptide ABC transporter ATP-binding protein n=1 Tax=Gallaecimonas xiamenensis 3-C-1 TaxID=745411 RepID=K2JP21_9GAMM|nr:peptide ABC transporter ATP-binding protein [Gallaecimonas xiamenensis 3-C-1]
MPLLEVTDLSKTFVNRRGLFKRETIEAVAPLSFSLEAGQTLAICGETGSGKTTVAKLLVGAEVPTTGVVKLGDEPLALHSAESCRSIRMIFQDPSTSLNPRVTVGRQLEEPLKLNTTLTAAQRQAKIEATLVRVGLLAEHADYYPHMISGGQKQRVALARALILGPKVLVCDEALAALDVSLRGQILNFLLDEQRKQQLGYVFVSHNMGIVQHISDYVLIMHHGQVVERGPTKEVFSNPQHEVTKRMLMAQNLWGN